MIERRTFFINGHRLVCLVAGELSKPPVVMVHGWAHYPDIWASTMNALADSHYCIAVGLLGMGFSDKPVDGDYRIEAHGRDVLAIADVLDIERFTLLGQSRGGQIALCIASQLAPERIIKLVDISGVVTGQLTPYMRWVIRPAMWLSARSPHIAAFLRWCFSSERLAALIYGPYMYAPANLPSDFSKRELIRGLAHDARLSIYRCMQTMCATDLRPYLAQISVPTLVLFGKQDGVVPVAQGRIAAQLIPNADLVLLDECGHYPMYEQPDQYLDTVKRFIKG